MMLVIPAIDLKNGSCVRLVQGRQRDVTVYDENPVSVAKQFAAAGARMIHVVDLDGAFKGGESPNRAVVKKIVEAVDVPVEFGGGIRSIDDVQQLCDAGVSRVVIGTMAVESPDLLKDLIASFGEKICVGIDARDGQVMTRGWEEGTRIEAMNLARSVAGCGVQRIIYTDIARDGMLTGPNVEQTVAVARSAGVHVTASGGVSSLDDIRRLRDAGEPLLDSVIVGKALYEQKFKLEDALNL
jgi:phosphoribosylformimino-5-aminoimidazole carboxamide ribotide isomerase